MTRTLISRSVLVLAVSALVAGCIGKPAKGDTAAAQGADTAAVAADDTAAAQ